MTEWVTGKVMKIKHWTKSLFSLTIHASVNNFIAGQFAKLRIEKNNNKIQRAYSYVNAPSNKNLEFYLVIVPQGNLSPLLHALQPGDSIMVTKEATGFFILKTIPKCETLWMLATGTAIGPYLSILEHGEGLDQFRHIILVHAVRYAQDLSYLPNMILLKKRYSTKLRIQTILSREQNPGSLTGRIPILITKGSLEAAVDIKLNANTSHIMLCGNPQMVRDTQDLLIRERGMRKHLKIQPGHITSENYW